jgi:hypothetical protein
MVHACNSSAWGLRWDDFESKASLGYIDPISKKKKNRILQTNTSCHSLSGSQDNLSMDRKCQKVRQGAMAHACVSSYSEGRDQEDHGSKPAPSK